MFPFLVLIILALAGYSCGDEETNQTIGSTLPKGVSGLVLVSGTNQSAKVTASPAKPLLVAAFDEQGLLIKDATVQFSIDQGVATLELAKVKVEEGLAQTSIQFGTIAGVVRVKATLLPDPEQDSFRTVYFDLTALADTPTRIEILGGNEDMSVCEESNWTVRLADDYGNGVPDTVLTVFGEAFEINDNLSSSELMTDADGKITFEVEAPETPGEVTLVIEMGQTIEFSKSLYFRQDLRWVADPGDDPLSLPALSDPVFLRYRLLDGCGPVLAYRVWQYYRPDNYVIPDPPTSSANTETDLNGDLYADAGPEYPGTTRYVVLRAYRFGSVADYRQVINFGP